MITVERPRIGTQRCDACDGRFTVLRGSAVDGTFPFASYIVGLHGHSTVGRIVQMAVAVLDRREPEERPVAVALEVVATRGELRIAVVEWMQSPWAREGHLGTMLDAQEVANDPLRPVVLDVANRVVHELPEVSFYLS